MFRLDNDTFTNQRRSFVAGASESRDSESRDSSAKVSMLQGSYSVVRS